MFQKIPLARRLFIRGEIDMQALKFLDMFGFLIRQVKDPDQGSCGTGSAHRHRYRRAVHVHRYRCEGWH